MFIDINKFSRLFQLYDNIDVVDVLKWIFK